VSYVNSVSLIQKRVDPPRAFWSGEWRSPTLADVPKEMDPEEREFARRLGRAIASARLAKDVSQEKLAEAAGVSTTTIGRWERGVNPPKSYQLAKIWFELRPLTAEDLFDPVNDLSDLDRRQIAQYVEHGKEAAWRPRRRATKRVADAPASRPAQRRPPSPPGSTRG